MFFPRSLAYMQIGQYPIDPPFFSYFPPLSMDLHVTLNTHHHVSPISLVSETCVTLKTSSVTTLILHSAVNLFISRSRNPFSFDCRQTWTLGVPSPGLVVPFSSTSTCSGFAGQ